MKKLLCLFLLVWLPLFSGAAAAMSMQMQLAALQTVADEMPCHESNTDLSHNPVAASGQADHSCCDDHETSHNCFACGVCALIHAVANVDAAGQLNLPVTASPAPHFFGRVFSSQLYPPALKPPISA